MTNKTVLAPMALMSGQKVFLGYNLPEEDLALVHPHWQTFEAPPFYYHLMLALIYFFLMITSTLGNGIVVWIFSS